MKTYQMKKSAALAQRQWYILDAGGKVLGRLATEVARVLRGKHKPAYTPHVDGGDFVVVVNARDIKLTGNKRGEKVYYRHSEYPGGIRSTTAERLLENNADEVIRMAVKGMLPKNRLSRGLLKKLKVYPGAEHPHQAQKPMPLPMQS
ncbi:MAG: 50S ribosomal protein L13 [Candidatus Binatia bacterium]|jgi:large subunit ribosomal protein L13|nr:50S ribosomal protein L13 [Candidatus Binatia bacterium]